MGKYDFTSIIDRRGSGAIAIDHLPVDRANIQDGTSVIPMWIADMNFATAPAVVSAIQERLAHPLFGYFNVNEEYARVIAGWQKRRNGVDIPAEGIGYENGVLGGISSAVEAFTVPGEALLIHSPTYIGFTEMLENRGRRIIHSPLVKDEQGIWRMDYADMEQKIKDHHIHFAIFCSPHNPCGRVWEEWEIRKAMEVYERHQVIVASDEIWSDLILRGHHHTPTQSVNAYAREHTLAFYAPSKTFSLSGLVGAYHVVYNGMLRDRLKYAANTSFYNQGNLLSVAALYGAYTPEGEEWLEELLDVLTENVRLAMDFIAAELPGVKASRPEGTYMLFMDCSGYLAAHPGTSMDALLQRGFAHGVIWQDGRGFVWPDAIRLNLALPKAMLEEALARMKEKIFI